MEPVVVEVAVAPVSQLDLQRAVTSWLLLERRSGHGTSRGGLRRRGVGGAGAEGMSRKPEQREHRPDGEGRRRSPFLESFCSPSGKRIGEETNSRSAVIAFLILGLQILFQGN
ncbi:hypothetical protein PR202_ga12280 [Eleusine coracana subsp. coracana]|uniref:Uncharacterized protein n=1 Tax=Eleusine coracana subsp. coracana TaxID=191504 RepID=A0AAV5CB93_ELECO|nr:hypothetical protein PR202_ga12280 [Eleusine coracana subsp. coracana]